MASLSFEKRKRQSGETTYRAIIRVKKNKKIIHQESKSFSEDKLAKAWGRRRRHEIETELASGQPSRRVCSIGEMLDRYIADDRLWGSVKRSRRYVVNLLRDSTLSKVQTNELNTQDLIDYCRLRNGAGASPSTVRIDISVLRSTMRIMSSAHSVAVDLGVFDNATPILFDLGLVSKSQRRSRRPSENEVEKIKAELVKRQNKRQAKIPLTDIFEFSILSCMRIGEVCKLRWDDLDESNRAVLVRNRKDPRKKEGNHMWCPLLGGAFELVVKQPRKGELIFPYQSRSVTAAFQRVRKKLGIEDLRYHDLRREGASRLFERGYSIDEVARVTGHRNINMLWQVYTELYPGKMRDLFKQEE
ncbi:tyrosine-type recombinase/integrase [Idiomarina abyssalis]|uniref:tyrosine-type recombinase/integrase n=1 Tax=Idiomarina abyssalis TaxID=86102 RepID=UPI001CD791C1|nr:site-specific integrase [Idiomarina abyssalis]